VLKSACYHGIQATGTFRATGRSPRDAAALPAPPPALGRPRRCLHGLWR